MIYESLSDRGLVDFGETTEVITDFFGRGETLLPADSDASRAVADLMHLNAAEASLLFRAPRFEALGPPLQVLEPAARFAIWATNSGPFVGHDPREKPALWDVTLLGGDASKLAWLSQTNSVQALRQEFDSVIRNLAAHYEGREDPFGFGRPDVLNMRATFWSAKIAVLLEEEDLPLTSELPG